MFHFREGNPFIPFIRDTYYCLAGSANKMGNVKESDVIDVLAMGTNSLSTLIKCVEIDILHFSVQALNKGILK